MILAAALYTVRHLTSVADLSHGLTQLRNIGYGGVEVNGMPLLEGSNPKLPLRDLRSMLSDAGLKCVGDHAPWHEIRDDTTRVIDRLHELGCSVVTIPFIDEYDRYEPASYTRFVAESVAVAAQLEEHGMRLAYHNHAHEFLRFGPDRRTLFDVLVEESDLAIEVDLYWAAFAGVDPARLIGRLHGRVPLIHCKDLEMIREGEDTARPFFAPVGEGNLDWDPILQASEEAGTQAWIVEQDQCRRDAFDCLQSSFAFLRSRAP